jgi:hypothetical protein
MGGRDQSERLVAINRNQWSQSAGTRSRKTTRPGAGQENSRSESQMSINPAPSKISESGRRRLAAARRANVFARNSPPPTVNAVPEVLAEKARSDPGGANVAVVEKPRRRQASSSPRPPTKVRPEEILPDSSHGERSPRAWVSLTTGQTGVDAPGHNGTPHPQNYAWKTFA